MTLEVFKSKMCLLYIVYKSVIYKIRSVLPLDFGELQKNGENLKYEQSCYYDRQ